jgi:hypothetical protein
MSNLSSFGSLLKPLMSHASKFAAKQKSNGGGKKKIDAKAKVSAKVSMKAK